MAAVYRIFNTAPCDDGTLRQTVEGYGETVFVGRVHLADFVVTSVCGCLCGGKGFLLSSIVYVDVIAVSVGHRSLFRRIGEFYFADVPERRVVGGVFVEECILQGRAGLVYLHTGGLVGIGIFPLGEIYLQLPLRAVRHLLFAGEVEAICPVAVGGEAVEVLRHRRNMDGQRLSVQPPEIMVAGVDIKGQVNFQ